MLVKSLTIYKKKTPHKGETTCARDSLLFIRDVDVGPKLDLFERSFPPPGNTGQNEQSKRRFAPAQLKDSYYTRQTHVSDDVISQSDSSFCPFFSFSS